MPAALRRSGGKLTAFVVLFTVLLPSCSSAEETSYSLQVGGHELRIEVAATPEQRSRGLMYRDSLAENAGMLFVFPEEREVSFWMKDTAIPLSIAYIRRDATIVGIYDMDPFSLEAVPSRRPVLYALEVNQGWFSRHGVTVGMRVDLPAGLPQAK